jgi:competence protein ComEA
VKGAVIKPGVYLMERHANVAQAILKAGGIADRARLDGIDLNQTLRDNKSIVVPSQPLPSLSPKRPAVTTGDAPPVTPIAPKSIHSPRGIFATPAAAILPAKIEINPGSAMLLIAVKGAVVKPGVYPLPPGSIVASAIVAAGGLAANAKADAINLQQPLRQGMSVVVPANRTIAASEVPTPGSPVAASPTPLAEQANAPERASTGSEVPTVPLNINSATVAQLQGLPGIGPSLASRIVAYRKEVGAFRAPEQLMDVKGITPEKFSLIQSHIRTN